MLPIKKWAEAIKKLDEKHAIWTSRKPASKREETGGEEAAHDLEMADDGLVPAKRAKQWAERRKKAA